MKIELLKKLQIHVREIQSGAEFGHEAIIYENLLMRFIDDKSQLKDETARKLQDCIELLPFEQADPNEKHEKLMRAGRLSQEGKEIELSIDRQRRISEFELDFADLQRRSILNNSSLEGMIKIQQLITNDIERLRATILHDKTSKAATIFKDEKIKLDKIAVLKNLENIFSNPNPDYAFCLKSLVDAIHSGAGQTASGLAQCLKYFPFEKTPDAEKEPLLQLAAKNEVKYKELRAEQIQREHNFSIEMLKSDDCDNPMTEMQQLIQFNIERLSLQGEVDTVTLSGFFKSSGIKALKKNDMEELNTLFKQDPVNLEDCIKKLILVSQSDEMKDHFMRKNDTGDLIKLFIKHFPYGKLPTIEAKRSALIALVDNLPDPELMKGIPIFESLIKLLRPGDKADKRQLFLNSRSSKEIYDIYSACEKLLLAVKDKKLDSNAAAKKAFENLVSIWQANNPYKIIGELEEKEGSSTPKKSGEDPSQSRHRTGSYAPSTSAFREENEEEIDDEKNREDNSNRDSRKFD